MAGPPVKRPVLAPLAVYSLATVYTYGTINNRMMKCVSVIFIDLKIHFHNKLHNFNFSKELHHLSYIIFNVKAA